MLEYAGKNQRLSAHCYKLIIWIDPFAQADDAQCAQRVSYKYNLKLIFSSDPFCTNNYELRRIDTNEVCKTILGY